MVTESRRYQTAARHYLRGRPPYAAALIRRVAQLCGLQTSHRVLDLGCGPGQLALAFAPLADHVIGVDPEPEMLQIAEEEAARVRATVEFQKGSSGDLDAHLGKFHLVVIGRAFHWMDREDVLRRLDQIIEPDGSLVLFGDDHPSVPDNRWRDAYDQLIDRYAAGDLERSIRRAPGWLTHEAVLLDSPFSHLERISIMERRHTPLDFFVDRALSMSSVAESRIGKQADEMAREVIEVMTPFTKDGVVAEVVESEALIARRTPAG